MKRISQLSTINSVRKTWGEFNPITRVVKPKKGKGSFTRQKAKYKQFNEE